MSNEPRIDSAWLPLTNTRCLAAVHDRCELKKLSAA
jgi:hypothetical protein